MKKILVAVLVIVLFGCVGCNKSTKDVNVPSVNDVNTTVVK